MIKAYKYKLKPNKTQETAMNQFLGSARFIYNWGLNRKTEQYKLNGTSLNYNALAKELSTRLLPYMLPNKYNKLNTLPFNSNGKIDRKILKQKYMEEIKVEK